MDTLGKKDTLSGILPAFVVSIDIELLWGFTTHPRHRIVSLLREDTSKGRRAFEILLRLFDEYDIPATWAIVGNLLAERYQNDPLYYGRDIVEKIMMSGLSHEIGYHSLSHTRFSECQREVAEAELTEGIKLASKLGIVFRSFVFPEDSIGHIDLLKECGFIAYRSCLPKHRLAARGLMVRLVSAIKSRLSAPPVMPIWSDGIWEIPSSMFFNDPLASFTLVPSAKKGAQQAIIENKLFHIFLHPENLLADPSLEKKLTRLLTYIAERRCEGKLKTTTMGALAASLSHEIREKIKRNSGSKRL